MKKLKRYNCTDDGSSYGSYGKPVMKEFDEGKYVKFSDIEPLIEALKSAHKNACTCCDSCYNVEDHCRQILEKVGILWD